MAFDMKDYVPVDERIQEFRAKFPEGVLTSSVIRWPDADFPFVVVQALAWRTPDDPCPAVGHAAEAFPGRTPYTKDSELMNAETSAWGRAIVAVGAADTKRGIASRDEVANRKGAPGASTPPSAAPGSGGSPSSVNPSGPTTSAKSRGAKAEAASEPEGHGEGPSGCAHSNTSPLLPSGRAVKDGFAWCIDCETLLKGED